MSTPDQPQGGQYPQGQQGYPQQAGGYQQGGYQQQPPAYQQPGYQQPAYGGAYPSGGQANQLSGAQRPGVVLAAAIIAFLLGALYAIVGVILIGASGSMSGTMFGSLGGLVTAVAVVVLLLAGLMIWGGIWAVNGRSYLLLTVTSIVLAVLVLINLISALGETGAGASIGTGVVGLLLLVAIAVMLLSTPSKQWFAIKKRL